MERKFETKHLRSDTEILIMIDGALWSHEPIACAGGGLAVTQLEVNYESACYGHQEKKLSALCLTASYELMEQDVLTSASR